MPDAQFLRYLLAGAANTAFGLTVYAVATWLGLPAWVSLLSGTIGGIAFNFVTLGGYAFRDLSLRRLPRFVCCYGAIYLVNLGALHALHPVVADPIVRQALLTAPMAVLSYLCMSRWVFRRGRDA